MEGAGGHMLAVTRAKGPRLLPDQVLEEVRLCTGLPAATA
jgi:hypothetical protein